MDDGSEETGNPGSEIGIRVKGIRVAGQVGVGLHVRAGESPGQSECRTDLEEFLRSRFR